MTPRYDWTTPPEVDDYDSGAGWQRVADATDRHGCDLVLADPRLVDDAEPVPAMPEPAAVEALADLRGPYRVPCDWYAPGDDRVIVFTADPVLAALVADELAHIDLSAGYPSVAGGGVTVDPVDMVLCGGPELVRWRAYRDGDPYALQACVVRPARPRTGVASCGSV